jgi:hypothetical protein
MFVVRPIIAPPMSVTPLTLSDMGMPLPPLPPALGPPNVA